MTVSGQYTSSGNASHNWGNYGIGAMPKVFTLTSYVDDGGGTYLESAWSITLANGTSQTKPMYRITRGQSKWTNTTFTWDSSGNFKWSMIASSGGITYTFRLDY